jgi:hypothetical protein
MFGTGEDGFVFEIERWGGDKSKRPGGNEFQELSAGSRVAAKGSYKNCRVEGRRMD